MSVSGNANVGSDFGNQAIANDDRAFLRWLTRSGHNLSVFDRVSAPAVDVRDLNLNQHRENTDAQKRQADAAT